MRSAPLSDTQTKEKEDDGHKKSIKFAVYFIIAYSYSYKPDASA